MNRKKLLERLSQGAVENVSFDDLKSLVIGFGFKLSRISGSHHIYYHPDVDGMLNLQEVEGKAKGYQIRQFLKLVEKYNLRLGDKND